MQCDINSDGQNNALPLNRPNRAAALRAKYGLSGNILKLLACVFMTVNHIGAQFFPEVEVLRIIGRLAFPIFAFLIAEGCVYTKNKLRYLLSFALLGIVCEVVYYIFARVWYGNILVTFSMSIFLIYLLGYVKRDLFSPEKSTVIKITESIGLCAVVAAVCFYASYVGVDYGAFGVLAPVLVSLFDFHNVAVPKALARLDCFPVKWGCLAVSLCLLAFFGDVMDIQIWSLFALLPVAFYSGKRSMRPYNSPMTKNVIKYSFYVYYPLHLAVIGLMSLM